MITKYASFDVTDVLDIKGAATQQHHASIDKLSDFDAFRTSDGYMYVRLRAISSRTNKNHDGWPTLELAGDPEILSKHHSAGGFTVEAAEGNSKFGFATFTGKPIFVDHNNGDPKRTRGAIVDSKFRILDPKEAKLDEYWGSNNVDPEHLPAAEVELLLEVDAKSFPKLATDILNGDLDGFSMGADVERSKCSHCGHVATNPDEYCSHVKMKGGYHDFKTADGKRTAKKSYENCYGIHFFEISAVFDPADPTALRRDVIATQKESITWGPDAEEGFGEKRDPIRKHDLETELRAEELRDQFANDPHAPDPMGSAVRNQEMIDGPLPAKGDGGQWNPKLDQYNLDTDNAGMPVAFDERGYRKMGPGTSFPPPVRPEFEDLTGPAGAFYPDPTVPGAHNRDLGNAADDALAEEYPKRPVMNDPRWSKTATVHTAEQPLPQSMLVHAPDDVDTMRDEQICPICGNDMDSEMCDVCGYIQEPKPFQNPDLSQAEKIREQMKQQDTQNAQIGGEPIQPQGQEPPQGDTSAQRQPLQGGPATKAQPTAKVTNEMTWTPLVSPKTAARINQVERPVAAPNSITTNEPKNQTVLQDQTKPVTSAMLTAQRLMANAQRNHTGEPMSVRTADGPTPPGDTAAKERVDVTGVGGVDEASNDAASKADAQVDVGGIGGTGVSDVSADSTASLPTASETSNDSGFNTDKTTEDSGPTATYPDHDGEQPGITDPVTSQPFPASEDGVKAAAQRVAYEDGTLEQQDQQGDPVAQGGTAVKGVSPADPVATPDYKRVNVLEHTTSPSNNSGETSTWSGTDGNGVLRQQEPVTTEPTQFGGVNASAKAHFMSALRLAETEQELGLISRDDKFNRVAELDAQTPQEVNAQLETLARVKTAGLAKLAQQRQAGVRSLPAAFGRQTAAPNGFERIASEQVTSSEVPVTDELMDAALFTR